MARSRTSGNNSGTSHSPTQHRTNNTPQRRRVNFNGIAQDMEKITEASNSKDDKQSEAEAQAKQTDTSQQAPTQPANNNRKEKRIKKTSVDSMQALLDASY